jgi:glycosyltransferase involved in cell wall biosynthesis
MNLVDAEDQAEAKRTRFVLRAGLGQFFRSIKALARRPLEIIAVLRLALVMGWRSDRGIIRHLAYVAEAAVLADWCRTDEIQHMHAHFGTNSAAITMFASRLSGIPYSFTAHGPEEFEKGPFLSLDLKLQNAAFAVCVSSFGRSQLMRLSQPDHWAKIAVVHCGVDRTLLTGAIPALPYKPCFVCIGRLSREKGQLLLVSAAKKLRDSGTVCEIVLVGDGPMRKTIEEAIRQAGLQSQFTITGWVSGDRVKAEIESARALVLPSFSEGLPVVIMEAMALNRPVISTYVAGIPELVQPEKTGWLVPAGDDAALADAIHQALAASAAHLADLGTNGRRRVLDQHDALKEAKKLKSLIEQHAIADTR